MQTKMIALPADSVKFAGSHVHNCSGLTVGNRRTKERHLTISEKAVIMCLIKIVIQEKDITLLSKHYLG